MVSQSVFCVIIHFSKHFFNTVNRSSYEKKNNLLNFLKVLQCIEMCFIVCVDTLSHCCVDNCK